MKVVHKYEISSVGKYHEYLLPVSAQILMFAPQNGKLCIWVETDPHANLATCQRRAFTVVGTGSSIPDGWKYRASCQDPPYVWHLYEAS